MKILGSDSGITEALAKAKSSGIDEKRLIYLLECVAAGVITDFFEDELINGEEGPNEIIINIPQFEVVPRHCRLSKLPTHD